MAIDVQVEDEALVVRFTGTDRLLTLSSGITLPWSEVRGARVARREDLKDGLGWRVGGGYWPGRLATGWFTVPGRKGARQLWCAFTDQELLVVDTTRLRPCRVVLQTPGRHDLAWWIGERASAPSAAAPDVDGPAQGDHEADR